MWLEKRATYIHIRSVLACHWLMPNYQWPMVFQAAGRNGFTSSAVMRNWDPKAEDSPAQPQWKGNPSPPCYTNRFASLGPCSRRRGDEALPSPPSRGPAAAAQSFCKLKNLLGWGSEASTARRRRPALGKGGSGPTLARQRRWQRLRRALGSTSVAGTRLGSGGTGSAPRRREQGPSEASLFV
jgi:hypothetical protein